MNRNRGAAVDEPRILGGVVQRLAQLPDGAVQPHLEVDAGRRHLFVTSRYGSTELVVITADGSDLTRISPGILADAPSWSADGTLIAFVYLLPYNPDEPWMPWSFVFVGNADGFGRRRPGDGVTDPTWRPIPGGLNDRPVASYTFECSGRGVWRSTARLRRIPTGRSRVNWWQFGDGATGSGSHGDAHVRGYPDVRLIVMDDKSALGTGPTRNVNQPPVVSFTTTCIGLTCTFDRSASFDPDGEIISSGGGSAMAPTRRALRR